MDEFTRTYAMKENTSDAISIYICFVCLLSLHIRVERKVEFWNFYDAKSKLDGYGKSSLSLNNQYFYSIMLSGHYINSYYISVKLEKDLANIIYSIKNNLCFVCVIHKM